MTGTIGEIRLFTGNSAPRDWVFCDGQTLPIRDYDALYTLIANNYGGDGVKNFQLPKLTHVAERDGGNTPVHYMICTQGYYPSFD